MTSKVFIFPTETSYGIGCDARDAAAVKKIFAIKGRSATKTMPLIAADKKMVEKFVDARALRQKEIQRAMELHWPGPLTLVLPANTYARKTLAPGIIAKDDTIAIRVPDHKLARELSKEIGAPIVATSANKAGEPACYSVNAVLHAFKNSKHMPDVIIDEGKILKRPASTIAAYKNGVWTIIRPGIISL